MKFTKHKYRLGRVTDVKMDSRGMVRTVVVAQRNLRRCARESSDRCKAGQVLTLVPVHRVAIILPSSETWRGDTPIH